MERTKTHESLYASSLIEASLDPLVTISTEGKVTDINQASVNITGVERNKIIGSDFFKYFTEPQKAREVYQEVFAKGSVVDSPLTLRHKNGKLTDVLFESAAEAYKNKLIGVVLTGSNNDGTNGIKRIQEYGGLAIIQNPETAESAYMPASAIAAIKPDYILSLKDITELLIKFNQQN